MVMNSLSRSDMIISRTPCTWIHKVHDVVMTSVTNLVFSGKKVTHLVHKSTTVSTYLKSSVVTEPGLYRSMDMERKDVTDHSDTRGVLSEVCNVLVHLYLIHVLI